MHKEQFGLKGEDNSIMHTSSCVLLGVPFVSSGFTPEDSFNNLKCQMNLYLEKIYQSACIEESAFFLVDPAILAESSIVLKSKKIALDRSFNAIQQVSDHGKMGEYLENDRKKYSDGFVKNSTIQPEQNVPPPITFKANVKHNFSALLHEYAQKNQIPIPNFDFFVERNLFGCSVEFLGTKYTLDATHQRKLAAKEAICKHILKSLIDKEDQQMKEE